MLKKFEEFEKSVMAHDDKVALCDSFLVIIFFICCETIAVAAESKHRHADSTTCSSDADVSYISVGFVI